ncbi:cellulose biosynthesis cyclic di-GMP-binding regulatory protein BcsB [Siccirubricoccus deserti]
MGSVSAAFVGQSQLWNLLRGRRGRCRCSRAGRPRPRPRPRRRRNAVRKCCGRAGPRRLRSWPPCCCRESPWRSRSGRVLATPPSSRPHPAAAGGDPAAAWPGAHRGPGASCPGRRSHHPHHHPDPAPTRRIRADAAAWHLRPPRRAIGIRADEVVTSARLSISGATSPGLLPELSQIAITLNEEFIGAVQPERGRPSFGPLEFPSARCSSPS